MLSSKQSSSRFSLTSVEHLMVWVLPSMVAMTLSLESMHRSHLSQLARQCRQNFFLEHRLEVAIQPQSRSLFLIRASSGESSHDSVDVGTSVGDSVGTVVGMAVGESVGTFVGTSVGKMVGKSVGNDVGGIVGEPVGSEVSSSSSSSPQKHVHVSGNSSLTNLQAPASSKGPSVIPTLMRVSLSESLKKEMRLPQLYPSTTIFQTSSVHRSHPHSIGEVGEDVGTAVGD
jgi:hypothetical protein